MKGLKYKVAAGDELDQMYSMASSVASPKLAAMVKEFHVEGDSCAVVFTSDSDSFSVSVVAGFFARRWFPFRDVIFALDFCETDGLVFIWIRDGLLSVLAGGGMGTGGH